MNGDVKEGPAIEDLSRSDFAGSIDKPVSFRVFKEHDPKTNGLITRIDIYVGDYPYSQFYAVMRVGPSALVMPNGTEGLTVGVAGADLVKAFRGLADAIERNRMTAVQEPWVGKCPHC